MHHLLCVSTNRIVALASVFCKPQPTSIESIQRSASDQGRPDGWSKEHFGIEVAYGIAVIGEHTRPTKPCCPVRRQRPRTTWRLRGGLNSGHGKTREVARSNCAAYGRTSRRSERTYRSSLSTIESLDFEAMPMPANESETVVTDSVHHTCSENGSEPKNQSKTC